MQFTEIVYFSFLDSFKCVKPSKSGIFALISNRQRAENL